MTQLSRTVVASGHSHATPAEPHAYQLIGCTNDTLGCLFAVSCIIGVHSLHKILPLAASQVLQSQDCTVLVPVGRSEMIVSPVPELPPLAAKQGTQQRHLLHSQTIIATARTPAAQQQAL